MAIYPVLARLPADIRVHCMPFTVTGLLANVARCVDDQFLARPLSSGLRQQGPAVQATSSLEMPSAGGTMLPSQP